MNNSTRLLELEAAREKAKQDAAAIESEIEQIKQEGTRAGHSETMSIRCPAGVLRALDEFCRDQHVSRSVAVRDAIINELRLAGYWPLTKPGQEKR